MCLSFSKSTLWQMSWMFVKGNSGGPRGGQGRKEHCRLGRQASEL